MRTWARGAGRAAGIRFDLRGLDHVDPSLSYVIAPLHEGFADVLAVHQLPLRLRWVARDEIYTWRLVGPILRRSGQIEVSPEDGHRGYRRLVRAAQDAVHDGESVVVFPQGSLLGIETAFQPGAFHLARVLDIPVLPVVITGTHRVWEQPFRPMLRFGQPVTVEVLPAIPADTAVDSMRVVESAMKDAAFAHEPSRPRRYVPERDGWWDGYRFAIDPRFPDLAARVERHRSLLGVASSPLRTS